MRRPSPTSPAPAIAAGLAVRLVLLVAGHDVAGRFTFADSSTYLDVATGLPSGLWDPVGPALPASLARPPLYPILAAATGAPTHLVPLVIAQVVLGAVVNVLLAHRLAGRIAGPRAAVAAGLISALDPVALGHGFLVATETLAATAVLALATLLHARLAPPIDAATHRPPTLAGAAAIGLVAAAGALVRPNLAVLVPFAALVVAVGARRDRPGLAPRLGACALALAAGLLPLAAWSARNHHVGGTAVLSTTGGQNAADLGLAAVATERGILTDWTPDRAEFSDALTPVARDVGLSPPVDGDTFSAATDRRWRAEGWALVRAHPRSTAVVAGRGLVRTVAAPGDAVAISQLPPSWQDALDGPSRPLAVTWTGVTSLLALVGTVALVRRRDRAALLAVVVLAALVLLSAAGPWMYVRFRVPVVPLLAVAAGVGVDVLCTKLCARGPILGRSEKVGGQPCASQEIP